MYFNVYMYLLICDLVFFSTYALEHTLYISYNLYIEDEIERNRDDKK